MSSTSRAAECGAGSAERCDAPKRTAPGDPCRQLSATPQLPQNLAPSAAAVPHCVQCIAFGAASVVPQLEQNFASGAFGAWQLVQTVPPALPTGPGPTGPEGGAEPGFAPGGGLAIPSPATMPPRPMPTPSAATPLPPPAAAPSPMPFKAAPTPYSRKPPASRVYAASLRKPLSVCSSSGLRLMVTLPSRVTVNP